MPKRQGLPTDRDFVDYIESWAKVTFIVPPRMNLYIKNEYPDSTHFPELCQC